MMKEHASFLEALGGGTSVAAELSVMVGEHVDRERVYKWKMGVPWRWRPWLIELAEKKGVDAPGDFLKPEPMATE